jgi:hypothetical protein
MLEEREGLGYDVPNVQPIFLGLPTAEKQGSHRHLVTCRCAEAG